jgi:hypothetical protein
MISDPVGSIWQTKSGGNEGKIGHKPQYPVTTLAAPILNYDPRQAPTIAAA